MSDLTTIPQPVVEPTTTGLKVDIGSMFGVSKEDLQQSIPIPTTRDFTKMTADILGVQLPTTSTIPPTPTAVGSDTSVQVRTDLPPTLTTVLGTTTAMGTSVPDSLTSIPPTILPQTGGPSIHDQIMSIDKKLDMVLQQLAGTTAAVPAAATAVSTGAVIPKVGLDTGMSWNSIFPAKKGGARRGRTARRRKLRGRTLKKRY